MADSKVQNSHLTKSLPKTRFPNGLWTLLMLPYLPFGLVLCLFRICISLQVILLLLIFPEGVIKRIMLRIFFTVLGVFVTIDGQLRDVKLIVSNKLSFVDHIALHLAGNCISVSSGGHVPPLAPLFPHWTFPASSNQQLLAAAKALPAFGHEGVMELLPYAIQPEPLPTNGRHLLLKFSEWPFSLGCPIQPMALRVSRPFPIAVSTVHSSGWWDLFWMLFVPVTVFHVRFLQVIKPKEGETETKFTEHVQQSLASALKVASTQISTDDVEKWLAGPPRPQQVANGPILAPSEFDPSKLQRPSELDTMVHQVTAVLPQVPYTVIKKDLMSTNSVDATITNLLEGRVKYSPLSPSASSSVVSGSSSSVRGTTASQVFRRKVAASSSSPSQRQLSLEERKRELLQSARRKYMEKHGL